MIVDIYEYCYVPGTLLSTFIDYNNNYYKNSSGKSSADISSTH